jgi:hypothetical protein
MTTQLFIDIPNSTQYIQAAVLVDALGNPYIASSAGSSSSGLSDTILTDDSLTQFLARDSGTAITYVTLAGAPYTPSTNIRAIQLAGGATAALQTSANVLLQNLAASTPATLGGASSTVASVAGGNSDITLLNANTARKGAIFYNTGAVAVNLLLNSGISSATNYSFSFPAASTFTLNAGDYAGVVKGFWAVAATYSPIQVTEIF